MPTKPAWYGRLDEIIADLRVAEFPYVTRGTIEDLLGVKRRRAQQIMRPCVSSVHVAAGLVEKEVLIERLKCISESDGDFEKRRRARVSATIQKAAARPRCLVESPVSVLNTRIENLPEGVYLEPGRIVVTFSEPQEALQKLLALAMAAGNDLSGFEAAIGLESH